MGSRLGKVFLVGAGPGDPGLITVKGKQCLERADVVIYDRLINHELLNFTVAAAELIYTGKKAGEHCTSQRDIETLLIRRARKGETVVRLKGGDPFVFGRGGEEAEALKRAGIPYEIVPGISSAIAAPAYAGIPLTYRGLASSVGIVTGHEVDKIKWRELCRAVDTIVILMGLGNLGAIMNRLLANGCDPNKPVALIQSGSYVSQKKLEATVQTVAGLAKLWNFQGPTLIVVGAVVELGKNLKWFQEAACGYPVSAWEDAEELRGGLPP